MAAVFEEPKVSPEARKKADEIAQRIDYLEAKHKEMKRDLAVDALLTALTMGLGAPAAITRQAASRGIVRGALRQIPSRKAALKWAKTHVKGAASTPEEILGRVRKVEVKPLASGRFGQAEEFFRPSTGETFIDVALNPELPAKATTWPHETWAHVLQFLRRAAGSPSAKAALRGSQEATAMAPSRVAPVAELQARIVGGAAAKALGGGPARIYSMRDINRLYDAAMRKALSEIGTVY